MNGRRMSIVLAALAVVLAVSAVGMHSDAGGAEPLGVQESIGEYTITFTVPSGVTYDIVDRGADSVSFTVGRIRSPPEVVVRIVPASNIPP